MHVYIYESSFAVRDPRRVGEAILHAFDSPNRAPRTRVLIVHEGEIYIPSRGKSSLTALLILGACECTRVCVGSELPLFAKAKSQFAAIACIEKCISACVYRKSLAPMRTRDKLDLIFIYSELLFASIVVIRSDTEI